VVSSSVFHAENTGSTPVRCTLHLNQQITMGKVLNVEVQPTLNHDGRAFSTYKLPIPVKFRIASETETIQCAEGPVTAQPGDAVMTSDSGKSWPIQAEKFWNTYEDLGNGTASKKKIIVQALQLDAPIEVAVSWANEPIKGQAGDYLIQGGPNDYWIVEHQEFLETYSVPVSA
jgi:hypothetical protein